MEILICDVIYNYEKSFLIILLTIQIAQYKYY